MSDKNLPGSTPATGAPNEPEPATVEAISTRTGTLRWVRLRVLMKMPLQLACALFLILMVIVAVAVAPAVQSVANHQDLSLRLLAPFSTGHGWAFVLGGDALGRPELAQVVYGARTSFLIASAVVLISSVTGTLLGTFSGFVGGWIDASVMRIADVVVAMPTLLIAVVVLFVLEPSLLNLVLVLSISRLPAYMRTARGQTVSLRERVFIEAARSLGATRWRIVTRDVIPLVVPTILTIAMLDVAMVILAASGLSFLGVGLERPNVDWGTLISDGRGYLTSGWWMTVFPGLAIALTSLAANFLANWLRAMDDPGQSGRLTSKVWSKKAREAAL